jgi:uncharacterized protein
MAVSHQEASPYGDTSSLKVFSPHYQPTTHRIRSLDILKGIAVLLGLFVAIYTWGGFSEGMQSSLIGKPSGTGYRLFSTISLLLEGKMRAMISLVFGAGIILFFIRPHVGSSLSVNDLYVRRNMWLILFGIVNAILFLWPMDIVFHLGIMGLLLFPFPRLSARWLLICALLVMAINAGKMYWYYHDDLQAYQKFVVADSLDKKFNKADSIRKKADSVAIAKLFPLGKDSAARQKEATKRDSLARRKGDTLTHKQAQDKQAWEGVAGKYKWERKNDSAQIKALQKRSWVSIYDHQLNKIQGRQAAWFYRTGVWEFAGIMLFGMWLFKIGFLTGRFKRSTYLWIALVCIGTGLLCGWYRLYFHNAVILDYTKYLKTHGLPFTVLWPYERALMVTGYASLLMFLLSWARVGWLMTLLGDVGRMALSNYFLQSILCSIIFYGFGMGYYARAGQYMLYFLVLEMIIVQIVFTTVWIRYFYHGPMEWLLRCLVTRSWVPNRRRPEGEGVDQEENLLIV